MAGQGMSRRQVLARGALLGAGLVAGGVRPNGSLPAARAASTGAGRISDIEHVVIFMQENRSFDHYFGSYPGVRGFSDPNALPGVFAQSDPQNAAAPPLGQLLPFHLDTSPGAAGECTPDITHYWTAQMRSYNHGAMDGWGQAHSGDSDQTYMSYYTRTDLPFYYAVADAFTLCDAYHCSAMASTTSNRVYAMTGMLDPDGRYGGPVTGTLATQMPNGGKFDPGWVTYPELLTKAGVSWKFYGSPDGNYEDNPLTLFKQYYPTNSGVDRGLAAELFENAFVPTYPANFIADVAAGTLPAVSWVIANVPQSEHPPFAPQDGEVALELALQALFAKPDVWAKTALFYTYDENGGYFDHVPPPTAPAGTPGEFLTTGVPTDGAVAYPGPIGLGFRVPMLVISPFSRGGFVCRADPTGPDAAHTFDHTSLLRFLETRFGVPVPNLSAWRRANTGDLTSALNFAAPDASIPTLPAVAPTNPVTNPGCPTQNAQSKPYPTPSTQAMPHQETGTRPSPSGPVV